MVFLCLYFLASLQISSIHNLLSHHTVAEADLHSADQEEDPCHIKLYHKERAGDCDHTEHFSELHKCSLCDSQTHNVQLFLCLPAIVTAIVIENVDHINIPLPSEGLFSYSSSRAPPSA